MDVSVYLCMVVHNLVGSIYIANMAKEAPST